jgi:hypothetical protein
MKRDENGIAVPHDVDPRPWKMNVVSGDRWLYDCNGNPVGRSRDTFEFIPHAANYHQRLADIVRRLADTPTNMEPTFFAGYVTRLIHESQSLWSEMADETKARGE